MIINQTPILTRAIDALAEYILHADAANDEPNPLDIRLDDYIADSRILSDNYFNTLTRSMTAMLMLNDEMNSISLFILYDPESFTITNLIAEIDTELTIISLP